MKASQAPESETPEQEFARRQEELAEIELTDSDSFLNREKKPWPHKSHLVTETRPGLKQRFPSRDIWEDTPDSLQLETTVAGPQSEEKELTSPLPERPTTGAVVYHQEKAAAGYPLSSEEGRATTGIAATLKPQVPTRPAKSKLYESQENSQPTVPVRPTQRSQVEGASPPIPLKSKPAVPARPSKPIARESSESIPLSTVVSNSSSKSVGSDTSAVAAAAKPKPPVPTRPGGSKIAALQGGFMSDLNKRLQLGPQAPKKEEITPVEPQPEKEKAPLVDARKGRARGPVRRAPAKSPTPASQPLGEKATACGICSPSTLWQIDPQEDLLSVFSINEDVAPETKAAQSETPVLATGTAEQNLHEPSKIALAAETFGSPPLASKDAKANQVVAQEQGLMTSTADDLVEAIKENGSPLTKSAQEEELPGSTATVKADGGDDVE
jgi:hypothetical protein